MLKELIIGLIYIIFTTIIVYPVTSTIADIMQNLLTDNLINLILINVVRYFGLIIGILTVNWINKSLQTQTSYTYDNRGIA